MSSARISGRLWKLPGTEPAAITASLPLERKRHTSHMSPGQREPPYSAAGADAFAVQRSGMRVPISVVFSRGMRRITSSR